MAANSAFGCLVRENKTKTGIRFHVHNNDISIHFVQNSLILFGFVSFGIGSKSPSKTILFAQNDMWFLISSCDILLQFKKYFSHLTFIYTMLHIVNAITGVAYEL